MNIFKKKNKNKDDTWKPIKKHNTRKRITLSQLTKRTLGSGNLRLAVEVPDGEDRDEWLAANTVDFYNEISLLYGLVVEDAQKQFKEPGEGFPPGYEYRWGEVSGKPIRVSSPEYVDYVMTWVEDQIDNGEIFPTLESEPFPDDFEIVYVKSIFKRMFRIFAILYHRHFAQIELNEAEAHLNTCFKHFLFFCLYFDLIEDKEMQALKGPVERLKLEYEELGNE